MPWAWCEARTWLASQAGMRRQKGMAPMGRMSALVPRWSTAVFTLGLALVVTAPCPAQDLQQIDKSTITIYDYFEAFPGYDVANCLDKTAGGTLDQFITDYASHGGGTATYISFDFGQQYNFLAILYTDRTTSGGPNNKFFGGTSDFNTSYMFTFSNDPTFATSVAQYVVTVNPPTAPTSVDSFQTLSILPAIPPCEYVQWQVLATGFQNPGAADFAFFGNPAQ